MKSVITLLAALILIVGMSGEVWATDLDVLMFITDWDGENAYNVQATVTLLNSQGQPIPGYIDMAMSYNSSFSQWTLTIQNVETTAVTAVYEWDPQQLNEWGGNVDGPGPGGVSTVELQWLGDTVIDVFIDNP